MFTAIRELHLLALVACLTLLGVPRAATAQPPPTLEIEAPASLAPARARLESFNHAHLADIVRLAGLQHPGPPIRVVLAEEFSEWATHVPSWVAGYAVGVQSLVVIFPNRSPRYPHDTLEDVLRHEVAHVLVSRAARGREVPRWLNEGFAVVVERPPALSDRARLASALLLGPRVTLDAIDGMFTGNESMQARGYALSAAFVRDLMREHGEGAPARLLRELAVGRSFDEAVAATTFRSVRLLEAEFWDRQRTWTMWVPIVASSSVLWLVVIGIGGFAVRRRRQRTLELRQRWAAEEALAVEEGEEEEPTVEPLPEAGGAEEESVAPAQHPPDERTAAGDTARPASDEDERPC